MHKLKQSKREKDENTQQVAKLGNVLQLVRQKNIIINLVIFAIIWLCIKKWVNQRNVALYLIKTAPSVEENRIKSKQEVC